MKFNTVTKRIFLAFGLTLLIASSLFAAEPLTLDVCINTALENHPDLQAAEGKIDSKKAVILQKKASGIPQLSGNVGYSRAGSSTSIGDTGSYGTSALLEQSIYDWGRRSLTVKNAELETEATRDDYLTARNKVISNVRTAYYSLNSAIRRNKVAQSRYNNYQKRLQWAESYYKIGTKAKIEVTKAQTDLANSKLALVRTESAIAQNRVQLASDIGEASLKIQEVKDVLDFTD